MAAPTAGAAKYKGATGNTSQTDDTSAMGGAPAAGELTDSSANLLFDSTPANAAGGADISQKNIFYRSNEEGAGGKMLSGKIAFINGLAPSAGTGVLTFHLTNPADVGLQVRIVCQVSGVWSSSEKTVMANPTVNSIVAPDAGKTYRLECLDAATGLTPTAPAGDILVSQAGQWLGRISGPVVDRTGATINLTMATMEYRMAVASAKNTNLSSANRLTAPSGIGAASVPLLIDGTIDTSLSVPDLNDGDYCGIAIYKDIPAGIPVAIGGSVRSEHNFRFAAVA